MNWLILRLIYPSNLCSYVADSELKSGIHSALVSSLISLFFIKKNPLFSRALFIPPFFPHPPFFPYGSRCLMRTKRAHSKLAPDSTMLKLFIHDSTPSRVVIKFLLTFYRILDRTFSLCSKLSKSLHLFAEISFSRWQIYVLCRTVSMSLSVCFTFLLFKFLYTWNCRFFFVAALDLSSKYTYDTPETIYWRFDFCVWGYPLLKSSRRCYRR